jgi:hypothetical protein
VVLLMVMMKDVCPGKSQDPVVDQDSLNEVHGKSLDQVVGLDAWTGVLGKSQDQVVGQNSSGTLEVL